MPEAAGEEWITPPKVAEMLGLKHRTIHALIDRGELRAEIVPPGKRGTGRRRAIRIRRQDVDDFIERARVKPGDLRHLHPEWKWERYG